MYCEKCNSLLNEDNICPVCDGYATPQETNKLSQSIEALKGGNQEAFNVFYNYTSKYVYSRAKALSNDEQTANDIMQEVYISAYKNINSLKSNDSVFAWLRTITFNASNRIMKKNKTETVLSEENEEMLEALPDENEQIEEDYMNKQDIEIIHACINRLSDEQRIVLLAYYYDNLKVEEIAELLQISSGTVKSRLFTARKNLKGFIEEEEKKNGYKLHSFSGVSLALALRKLLQENMNNPTINTETLCQSIYEKINSPVNNSAITSATEPKTKLIKGISRTSKSKMVQKIAEISIKKIVLSTVAAVVATGIISGTIAVVTSNLNNVPSFNNTSSDESSITETSSDEAIGGTGSEESSSQTSTPSKTESSSAPTTSTNKTESKVETSSTPQKPSTPTYLEKNNLKLTSIDTNICFNMEEHECMKNKKISIGADSHINIKNFASFFQYEPFVSSDINKYKTVTFTLSSSENGLHWNCGSIDNVIPFDKYTGAVLAWGIIGNGTWREVATNDRNIYVTQQIGHREYEYEHTIICPKDYDGIIFAVVKDVEIPWGELSYGKPYNIDEIIDFQSDEYYLFSAN